MAEPNEAERAKAEELLSREYGKDHPAARHQFTITFMTTTHKHRVRELAQAIADAREKALEEAAVALDPWAIGDHLVVAQEAQKRIRALKGKR